MIAEHVTLPGGTMLGPYEVLSLLGAGGMGEVYRARDSRLDRAVAIKILRSGIAGGDLRARFEREARAISHMSHPHICAIYDIGNQDGSEYLVMEYVEGETLAERIRRGPLAVSQHGRVMSVVPNASGDWSQVRPTELFRGSPDTMAFAVTPDGQSFLLLEHAQGESDSNFHVALLVK